MIDSRRRYDLNCLTEGNTMYNSVTPPFLMKICRICLLETKEHAINLSSEYKESRKILSKIYLCFGINIAFDKSYPNIMCCNCINVLNEAYDFRVNCLTFNENFKIYCKEMNLHTEFCYSENKQMESVDTDFEFHDDCVDTPKIRSHNETVNTKEEVNKLECIPLKDNPSSGSQNGYKCNMCSKILKSKLSLAKHFIGMHHKRKHVGTVSGCGVTRRYHCTICSYSTPYSRTLANHMNTHNGMRPYHCECGKSFTQSSSLSAHRKTHSNNKLYSCTICGKQFKHAFSFKRHLLVHDTGNYNCEICLKQLKTKQSLQDHMNRHNNIRNFNCEDCGSTFVTTSELHKHRLKHRTIKKVECNLCGYKTNSKKTLIVHLKRHAGDRSHKCSVCARAFYTRGELRRHGGVHARAKPYPCPACAQRLARSSAVNKHMLAVHGIRYRWADFKGKK